jgi:hypothetical protein
VPWNIQTANSDPGNLIWEKDKSSITCTSPGLYEIQFGVFSRRRPAVRMNVNGETILSIVAGSCDVKSSKVTIGVRTNTSNEVNCNSATWLYGGLFASMTDVSILPVHDGSACELAGAVSRWPSTPFVGQIHGEQHHRADTRRLHCAASKGQGLPQLPRRR